MEIICIEKNAFETMIARFEQVAAKVQAAGNLYRKKEISNWYDNRDVCRILRISPRKLQSLRDSGSIPYVKINGKIIYKPDDIHSIVKDMQSPV
jgi:hypothetical protein